MIHLYLDTNVLIDFLANRTPFSIDAAKLFNYALKKKICIYVSAVSYNNIYYILRQSNSHLTCIQILSELQKWSETVNVTKVVIANAVQSDFKDFEDAIQYECAKTLTKISCIVTRNTKDFKKSTIPTMTPKEALTLIET